MKTCGEKWVFFGERMDSESGNRKQEFLQLPVVTVNGLERAGSLVKEKVLLIALSTLLFTITSLSAAYFIVDTVVLTPSMNDLKVEYSVRFWISFES